MRGMRTLSMMLRVLGWAAIPSWPAGAVSAILWTGRAELLLLSVAGAGTSGAVALAVLRWAEARARSRAAEYERLERLLVGAIADLHPRAAAAMTRPDLRVVR